MNINEQINFYNQEIKKIPEKFEKIKEVTRKWLYFDCFRLQLRDFSGYENLFYFDIGAEIYFAFKDKDEIHISFWCSFKGEFFTIIVNSLFFDDFEKFIEELNVKLIDNNVKERDKYFSYLELIS